jgi:hypothetical protein
MLPRRARRARTVEDWWPALDVVVAHALAGVRDDAERGGIAHLRPSDASKPWLCPRLRAFARIANVAREINNVFDAQVAQAFGGSADLGAVHVWWARVRSGMVHDLPYIMDGLPRAIDVLPSYQGVWPHETRGPQTQQAVADELMRALDCPVSIRGEPADCRWESVVGDECRDYLFSQAMAREAAHCASERLPLLRAAFANTPAPQPCSVVGLPARTPSCIVAGVLRLRACMVLMNRRGARALTVGAEGLHRACANRNCRRICFTQQNFGNSPRNAAPLGWRTKRAYNERCRALLPWAAFANVEPCAQRYWLEAGLGCNHVGEEPAVSLPDGNLGACCSTACAAVVRQAVARHVPFAERVVDTFDVQHKPIDTPLEVLADAVLARNAAAHAALRAAPRAPPVCPVTPESLALFERRLRRALSVDAMLVHVAMLCHKAGRAPLLLKCVYAFVGAKNWRMESRYRYPLNWLGRWYDAQHSADSMLRRNPGGANVDSARKQLLVSTRVGSSLGAKLLQKIETRLFEEAGS